MIYVRKAAEESAGVTCTAPACLTRCERRLDAVPSAMRQSQTQISQKFQRRWRRRRAGTAIPEQVTWRAKNESKRRASGGEVRRQKGLKPFNLSAKDQVLSALPQEDERPGFAFFWTFWARVSAAQIN